jgi:site-specific DNA-methyltransferase (adenine-specific)
MVAIPTRCGRQRVITGDCLGVLPALTGKTVDVCITSPPYNLGIKYASYEDKLPREEYLLWLAEVFKEIERLLKDDGSFFLNVGYTNLEPWVSTDVSLVARTIFTLQNRITWNKSITVGDTTTGHFKPINSGRFLNYTTEDIFHFTKRGDVKIDRLAIGVPYADKANVARFSHGADLRCRGNSWFIPYQTAVNSKGHPAGFPVTLPEMCIRLHGLRDGMKVLDPFAGHGSTLIAAQRLGVDAIGIELDPGYAEMARSKVAPSTTIPVRWQKSDSGLLLPGRPIYSFNDICPETGRVRLIVSAQPKRCLKSMLEDRERNIRSLAESV